MTRETWSRHAKLWGLRAEGYTPPTDLAAGQRLILQIIGEQSWEDGDRDGVSEFVGAMDLRLTPVGGLDPDSSSVVATMMRAGEVVLAKLTSGPGPGWCKPRADESEAPGVYLWTEAEEADDEVEAVVNSGNSVVYCG